MDPATETEELRREIASAKLALWALAHRSSPDPDRLATARLGDLVAEVAARQAGMTEAQELAVRLRDDR